MKKIVLTFFALSLVLSSCDFDKGFEEMNVNPAKASQLDVANKFASAVLQTSGGRYENWRASLIYQSVMIQHFLLRLDTGQEIDILEMMDMQHLYGIVITHQLLKRLRTLNLN